MKILWFEISIPSKYQSDNRVLAGWQDALEEIVSGHNEIDLFVAFETNDKSAAPKFKNNVHYVPIVTLYSWLQRKKAGFNQYETVRHILPQALQIIKDIKPDLIHVFGCEWPYGLVAKYTDIPVVIHIQGAIIPYTNALYPPKYNNFTLFFHSGINIKIWWKLLREYYYNKSRKLMESEIWRIVDNYMGRTLWDKSLCQTIHPKARYFHVEEAIRPIFLKQDYQWHGINREKLSLISTGISFWKGADVMLKTAHVLKSMGVDFEWKIAGAMDKYNLRVIEEKEQVKFRENNIEILGFTQADELLNLLCNSSLYIHTAYIENSPNSICEAQLIGIPVIATYVGGIPSLVSNNEDGILVPANDPWQMANEIVTLFTDKSRMEIFSKKARTKALQRHDPNNIFQQLLHCYNSIIVDKNV